MSTNDIFIFEVSENNFDTVVIQNSYKLPVLVEFMGVWSGPCIQMSDELSLLAKDFAGEFIFAKVDIDEQEKLMEQYGVKNVPNLQVFVDGEVILVEEGLLTQVELREILKGRDVYSRTEEMRLQAREMHMSGDTIAAVKLLTEAMQKDRSNANIAMDMVQIFVDMNELETAQGLFNQLPDSLKTSDMGKSLIGQLTFLDLASKTAGKFQLQQQLMSNPSDWDAHFDLALCFVAERDYQQAVDQLFEIVLTNPSYKNNAAKEMIITVSNMLKPNNPELASKFRSKLSSITFS